MRIIWLLLIIALIPLKNLAGDEDDPPVLFTSPKKTVPAASLPVDTDEDDPPVLFTSPKKTIPVASLPVDTEEPLEDVSACCEEPICCEPDPRWYFEVKPGYFYFTDSLMREFYGNGGFTIRAETGYKMWGPFYIWLDGGYFQEEGESLGISAVTKIKLATITLGLKTIFYLHDRIAFYAGAGPRVFMMMLHNASPFVRGEDNEISIGTGVDAGFWVFPFPFSRNLFIDLFADYSFKKLEIEPDEISSHDFDVNVSGLTLGAGLGIRF